MLICSQCGRKITWGEFKYSLSVFRRALCQDCQKKAREASYPPKLARFINNVQERRSP